MGKRIWRFLLVLAAVLLGIFGDYGNGIFGIQTVGADWYGTTYEVFVYSFCDGNGDGIGDLKGLAGKLDYIADYGSGGLGCDAIWTTPIFPSPTYHKYDVTDYLAIDPEFGTMEDFDALLAQCHARGVKLILDLPVNHTSSEHPWFLAAAEYLRGLPADAEAEAGECPYADYYHFTKEAQNGYAALSDTEWYYEAQFWEGMPDLNLDSEAVRDEIAAILRFWMEKGVDGFRLDAVTSYYTGDQAANLAFLTWLNDTAEALGTELYGTDSRAESGEADAAAEKVYFVGEAWTDQNSYAAFYASGIDSLFDFAFAGQDGIIANVVRGSRSAEAFVDAMTAEEALYASYNPAAVNAPFYTNHDMARSAGYYAYDDGTRTKLAEGLNLLMTGNAFLYYGEEIGMKGAGKDENKRAPMYWTEEGGAEAAGDDWADGMCDGPPDMDAVSMKFGSCREQMADLTSVYQYVREAVRIRREFPVIAGGRTVKVSLGIAAEGGDAGSAASDAAADGGEAGRAASDAAAESAALEDVAADGAENRSVAAFFRESDDGEAVLVVLNTGEEAVKLTLDGEAAAYETLAAELETGADSAAVGGGVLTLPAFGIAVLTE